jgi:hypothetical protein
LRGRTLNRPFMSASALSHELGRVQAPPPRPDAPGELQKCYGRPGCLPAHSLVAARQLLCYIKFNYRQQRLLGWRSSLAEPAPQIRAALEADRSSDDNCRPARPVSAGGRPISFAGQQMGEFSRSLIICVIIICRNEWFRQACVCFSERRVIPGARSLDRELIHWLAIRTLSPEISLDIFASDTQIQL